MRIAIGNCFVECVQSDVDNQVDVDGLFYYLPEPAEDLDDTRQALTSTLHPGQTSIEALPGSSGRHIIHALGPSLVDDNLRAEIVKCCLANAIALCEQYEVRSVALSLTEGMTGKIPVPLVAEIAAKVIADHALQPRHLRVVRFGQRMCSTEVSEGLSQAALTTSEVCSSYHHASFRCGGWQSTNSAISHCHQRVLVT
jgi:hypothetical protein